MKTSKKNCMFSTKFFIASVFVSFLYFPGSAVAQDRDDRDIIYWPSTEYRTIQSAVDALPEGGVLQIAEGRYFIEEPVFVRGKKIVIKGAGSGLEKWKRHYKNNRTLTHLIGPEPRPVLDERRNVILPAERAEGVLNFIAADAVVRDLILSGSDAGIVVKNNAEGDSESTMVSNVLVKNTGRGIAALSSGNLFVESSAIKGTLWHGIVISPPIPFVNKAQLENIFIRDTGGWAVYFNDTYGILSGGDVAGGLDGGVLCYECELYVVNSHIHFNHSHGILLLLAKNTSYISSNLIEDTRPNFFNLRWGDGITSVLSKIHLWNNHIEDSARAGLSNFGGHAALGNNTIQCAGFELEGETIFGQKFTFDDSLGNNCGCPVATGSCVAESAGLEPPEPVVPIE